MQGFLPIRRAITKSLLITRKIHCSLSNQFCLTPQSVPLDCVYLFKYLGVLISHNLCWSAHISDIVHVRNRLIYRKFYRFNSAIHVLILFKSCTESNPCDYLQEVFGSCINSHTLLLFLTIPSASAVTSDTFYHGIK